MGSDIYDASGQNGTSYDGNGRAAPESLKQAGADYGRIAGIRGHLHRHNLGTAYGHNSVGNTFTIGSTPTIRKVLEAGR